MKHISELNDIDYKGTPEGRLLFSALAILTVDNYPNNTPDEVIEILNEKADSFLPKEGETIIE